MSVVNKMLQDLETRQAQPDGINADYQPPEKKLSTRLIAGLLLLALTLIAIIYGFIGEHTLFRQEAAKPNTQQKPILQTTENRPKKMSVVAKSPDTVKKQVLADTSLSINAPLIDKPTVTPTTLITEPLDTVITDQIASTPEDQTSQNKQIQQTHITEAQAKPQIKPSFSMSDSSNENQKSSLKQRIADSLSQNNNNSARLLLTELLKAEPNNTEARKKLASLHFAQGNYRQTELLLTQGVEQQPNQTDLKLMLARLYASQEDLSKALKVLTDFQPHDNKAEYLAYRAALAQQLNNNQLAKSDYQTLTKSEPSRAKWWLGLAVAEDKLANSEAALQAYKQASYIDQLDASVNEFIQQRILILASYQ
jgi:MSHA biogenesis protein MshN